MVQKFIKPCLLLQICLGILLTSSSQELIVSGKNNSISNPAFSIEFPDSALNKIDHWYLKIGNDIANTVTIEASRKRRMFFSMRFFKNPILSDSIRHLPVPDIANDFRNQEVYWMNLKGVEWGNYQLEDVQSSEDTIDNKLFYTLTYKQIKNSFISYGRLYLLIPNDQDLNFIMVGHYAEIYPVSEMLSENSLMHFNLFKNILGTMQYLPLPFQKPKQ